MQSPIELLVQNLAEKIWIAPPQIYELRRMISFSHSLCFISAQRRYSKNCIEHRRLVHYHEILSRFICKLNTLAHHS